MGKPKRYALMGAGIRASIYLDALCGEFRANAELVGLCDTCRTRMEAHNRRLAERYSAPPVPLFSADQFETMIREARPDVVIITSPDHTHDEYAVRALHSGCDVICEKPLAIDATRVKSILDAVRATGRSLRVALNLRYAPHVTRMWELVRSGAIGKPTAVDFSYLLDTRHGADYFRRWHARKELSGGLLVHKATHHFDLVNWWLEDWPAQVCAMGSTGFYGPSVARDRQGNFKLADESFDAFERSLYLGKAQQESGYDRNADVFGSHVSIEDTLAVVCRYRGGAILNYSLVCYAPWEGFRVALTGTAGRLELHDRMSPDPQQRLMLMPLDGPAQQVPLQTLSGIHGGADPLMLRQLLDPGATADSHHRDASHLDGAASALVGIAGNESIRTGRMIDVEDLFSLAGEQ